MPRRPVFCVPPASGGSIRLLTGLPGFQHGIQMAERVGDKQGMFTGGSGRGARNCPPEAGATTLLRDSKELLQDLFVRGTKGQLVQLRRGLPNSAFGGASFESPHELWRRGTPPSDTRVKRFQGDAKTCDGMFYCTKLCNARRRESQSIFRSKFWPGMPVNNFYIREFP